MNNQENKSRRTLKNSDYNKILENTVNTEDDNKQIPETVQNTQEKQVNENQQINIESSPALYSRDQIINNQAIPVQVPAQQNQNTLNNNVVNDNQVQPVPIRTTQTTGIRYIPSNGIPLNAMIAVIPQVEKVSTYKPVLKTCPYCTATGMTVPENISWNCCACFMIVLSDMCCLGLTSLIRLCMGSDCCCYDAKHKCSNCGRIIAERNSLDK
jgi:hypothetical protein